MSVWVLRILFLSLSILGGYAISQVQPELIENGRYGAIIGFGFGGFLIAIDEMLRGFSLRAFSAATFGLFLGTTIAWMIDRSELFVYADQRPTRWIIRLTLFIGFSYIGMILAMRSNKEDFSLIIPFVRFSSQQEPHELLVLDTSVIIDGRIAGLIENRFLEGVIVVPRFVLRELQQVADSTDPIKRARGRRGLEMLSRLQRNPHVEVKVHETDFPEETGVDAKLIQLARVLKARLYTTDFNLGKIAELQSVRYSNINELAQALKATILPGDVLTLKVVRDGKDRGQGVGYTPDGSMVVINNAHGMIGHQVEVVVQSVLQSNSGVIFFSDLRSSAAAAPATTA